MNWPVSLGGIPPFPAMNGVLVSGLPCALLFPDPLVYFCSQFSQMIKLYHSLGPEKFPLNEQAFYPNHTQMVSTGSQGTNHSRIPVSAFPLSLYYKNIKHRN